MSLVPQQYFKKLAGTNGLWEIRVQIAANNYRLLGFFDGATLLILTGAFLKKQQKTSQREIELAQNRRDEYYQRRKQS